MSPIVALRFDRPDTELYFVSAGTIRQREQRDINPEEDCSETHTHGNKNKTQKRHYFIIHVM